MRAVACCSLKPLPGPWSPANINRRDGLEPGRKTNSLETGFLVGSAKCKAGVGTSLAFSHSGVLFIQGLFRKTQEKAPSLQHP